MKPDETARFWLNGAGRITRLTAAEEIHLGASVRRWQDHPGGPSAAPTSVQRRGLRARNRIVEANLRLVHMVALRIKGRAPLADMMQSGIFGLIRAAEKFDPERGYKFSTYAYFWILQSMKRGEAEEYTIALPFMLINKVMCGQEVELSGESVAAAKNAYSVRSLDMLQFFDDGDGESLGDAIHGGSLDAGDLGWSAALGALQEVDPDDLALLTLHGVDGATYRDLAQLEDVDPKTMGNRVRETRARLAAMPEVRACLA